MGVLHAHPGCGESRIQRNANGEVATTSPTKNYFATQNLKIWLRVWARHDKVRRHEIRKALNVEPLSESRNASYFGWAISPEFPGKDWRGINNVRPWPLKIVAWPTGWEAPIYSVAIISYKIVFLRNIARMPWNRIFTFSCGLVHYISCFSWKSLRTK